MFKTSLTTILKTNIQRITSQQARIYQMITQYTSMFTH